MEYVPPINGNLADPDRSYVNANPGASVEGSIPAAESIEHTIREIVNVIEEAGLTPDGGDLTQLYQAIGALIALNVAPDASETVKGIVELATGAEALGGSDTTRAVTSAGLASTQGKTSTASYIKLPGGLIIQAGKYTGSSFNVTVTFPIAFPTAAVSFVSNADDAASQGLISDYINLTTSNVAVQCYDLSPSIANYGSPFSWFAFGY